MTRPESVAVVVELSELRGEMRTSFADIKRPLGVLSERTSRTDADVKQLRADTDKEVAELRADVEALKRARLPLPTIGVISGIGGAVAAAVALFQH